MKQYNVLVKLAKRKLLKVVFRLTLIIKVHNIDNKSIIEILKQLQGKGLINQLYKPIDTGITSKARHSTTSQSITSPIAEKMILLISLPHQ